MDRNAVVHSSFDRVKKWGSYAELEDNLILIDGLVNAPIPQKPVKMNFIIIALCTAGKGTYLLNMQEQTITPGDVIIVSENHIVDNIMVSPDLNAIAIALSMDFYHEVIRNVGDISALFLYSREHPVMSLQEREQKIFKDYFNVLVTKVGETDNHFRKDLIRTLLLAMCYDLSNVIYHTQKTINKRLGRADIIFTKFIKLVEENCKTERRVSWYAKQLCITPKYLCETVKAVSRRTPNKWIENYVTLEMRMLLKNSTKSIKEITRELNFPNQSFFGKFFKQQTGVSPLQYRKS